MYIYKRQNNECKLLHIVDVTDEYELEEKIIHILQKTKEYKKTNKIFSKFTGYYTVYHFNGKYALIASPYRLDEAGNIINTTTISDTTKQEEKEDDE